MSAPRSHLSGASSSGLPQPLDGAPSPSRLPRSIRRAALGILGAISLAGRPWARRWARPGYFEAAASGAPRSIALIACHWIGDTLWASQVLPTLRATWPEATLTVLTKPRVIELWRGLLPPERIIPVAEIASDRHRESAGWIPLIRRARSLREHRFDLVFDLTGNRYSALFAFLLRPARAIGPAGNELAWLYSPDAVPASTETEHLRERPFRIIRRAIPGARSGTQVQPPVPAAPFGEICVRCGLDESHPVVIFAPGAGWPEKRWPKETFRAAVEGIARPGVQVAILGSPDERELCAWIASGARNAPVAIVTGLSLGEASGLLSGAAAVIGHDSGLVHLAAAYGRRVLALYTTATEPAWSHPVGPVVTVRRLGEPGADPQAIVEWVTDGLSMPRA